MTRSKPGHITSESVRMAEMAKEGKKQQTDEF
jgi:hypothetical protein